MTNIVIVGGGTAGWMAAMAIASRFPDKRISVLDPVVIGPIGVGESVTGVVRKFVQDPLHKLSLGEFFRRCDVTLKAGIWYKDWQGPGSEYLTPIDSPPDYFKHFYETAVEEFFALAAADGARLGDVQLYSRLMRSNTTDYFRNPDGSVNTQAAQLSCHFDALKFALWLREVVVRHPNITHVDDVVDGFELHPQTGYVTSIRTKAGRQIEGDFFIDCSGFHHLLLAKAYQPKWKSYADYVKVDTAIPFFQQYTEGQAMPTYSMASAMPAGWVWQIPTQSRLGRGYLFASRYLDTQGALEQIRAIGLTPPDNPRVLRFDPGRYDKAWIKNVCTIGLSGGFIEPLESSTIHLMYVQIRMLTELLIPCLMPQTMAVLAEQYNRFVDIAYEDYIEFITFHYHTGRNDSEFWRDYQKPSAILPNNQARMEKWRYAFPVREDFTGIFSQRIPLTTGLVIWAPMLDGMGFFNRQNAQKYISLGVRGQMLNENVERYMQVRNRVTATALTHAEAIEYCRGQP